MNHPVGLCRLPFLSKGIFSFAILAGVASAFAQGGYIVPKSNTVPIGLRSTHAATSYLISAFPRIMPWHRGAGPLTGPAQGGIQGLYPKDLQTAYGMPTSTQQGANAIAIIDAFDYSTALSDFNLFSTTFGLPQESSSDPLAASNKVLQVVYTGGVKPPDGQAPGWNGEEALDIEWAHALAPKAKIYLVEAQSNSFADFANAIALATTLPNVKEISMSWGTPDFDGEQQNDPVYSAVTKQVCFACAGDTGAVPWYPSISPYVVGVGGTHLDFDSSGNFLDEIAWGVNQPNQPGSGGGPSAFEPRPAYQDVIQSIVGQWRGDPDVSALADPNSGVAIYDSPDGGWMVFGGTSLACPLNAAMRNTRGSGTANATAELTKIYSKFYKGPYYRDITVGFAGNNVAQAGWDYITGIGSPVGLLPLGPPLSALAVPTTMAKNSTAQGSVSISGPSPSDGTVISLSSNNTPGATVPAQITILSGATSASFTITSNNVPADENVWITATDGTVSLSKRVTVVAAVANVTAISLAHSSVTGGSSVTGTVTLDTAAPSNGIPVKMTSDNGAASAADTIVPAGQTSGTFSVQTKGVGLATIVHITGNAGSGSKSAALTINPASLSSVGVSPTIVYGGRPGAGTVTLNGFGKPTGSAVYLTSSNTSVAKVPASIVISNSTTGTFTVTTFAVTAAESITIKATYNSVVKLATLSVRPAVLISLGVGTSTVTGGTSESCGVTLSGIAPSAGLTVTLTSSNTAVAPAPSKVVVPAGRSSMTFAVPTKPVNALTAVYLTAKCGTVTKQKVFSVLPPAFSSFALKATSVYGGTRVIGVVTLSGKAGPAGVSITPSSSVKTVATVPLAATVPSGATIGEFYVTTLGQTKTVNVTIGATIGKVSKAQILTVKATTLDSLTLSAGTVKSGSPVLFTVSLAGAAPVGGASIAMKSSLPQLVIPASPLTIAGGRSSASLSWPTSSGATTTFKVTISATYAGKTVSAVVTITP